MVDARLLALRNRNKARKPMFLRQDAHKRKKLSHNWRQPKGMDSKLRLQFRSRRSLPSPGYSSPRKVRGLNRQGFQDMLIRNINDLATIDPKTHAVLVAHVGMKKKIAILTVCQERKLHVANVRDVSAFLKKVDEENKAKQNKKKERETQNKKTEETKKKKEEKKEEKSDATPDEETKKGQKSDKIKVLEKRE